MTFFGIIQGQRYMGVNVDNDLYFGIDQYYSSGIFLEYGKVLKSKKDSIDKDQVLVSHHWTLGQEINTPSYHQTSRLSKMDYPYSGWLFLRFFEDRFKKPDFGIGWGVEVGTTGADASLARPIQNNYHKYILNLNELSWAYSIPQQFHFNFQAKIRWGIPIIKRLKLVQESRLDLGTFRTGASSRIGFQIGNLEGLPFFGNRLEIIKKGTALFLGKIFHYNYYEYSLVGNLNKTNSPFDFVANKFVDTLQAGIVFYSRLWRAHFVINSISKRLVSERSNRHPYLNITLIRLIN